LAAGAASLVSVGASGHIKMSSPAPRDYILEPPFDAEIKDAPCGRAGGERTDVVNTFEPGATIAVTWDETIGHPGHFRISFDDDGDDAFVDPTSEDDLYNPSEQVVLLDDIADKSGTQSYEAMVTLPDIECDNCTLQLMQVMTDKQANGWGNDEFYYMCANIVLAAGGTSSSSSGSGASGSGSGATSGSGAASGTGASSGTSGPSGAGGSDGDSSANTEDDGGCAVRSPAAGSRSSSLALAGLALGLGLLARRRRSRR